MSSYPVFDLDEDGNIVIDWPDEGSDVSAAEDQDVDSDEQLPGPSTISGGNAVFIYQLPQEADTELTEAQLKSMEENNLVLGDISDSLERILQEQASSSGYLSASALDVFDRVIYGYNYDYYIAFRYDTDNYNSRMYLSNVMEISGNNVILKDVLAVQLYRVYYSSTRTYTYHYSISSPGDVSVSMSGNLLYYTNCVPGYPVLGQDPAPGHYPGWFIPLAAVLFFVVLISLVRRKS